MDDLYQRVTITLSDGTTWTGTGPAVEQFAPGFTVAGTLVRVLRVTVDDPKPLPPGCSWGPLHEEAAR